MKLSKLYSNFPDKFSDIHFRDGLNVVLAEIRLPKNKNKDTHNLGKTLLGQMIDFCLLADRNPEFFLFKYPDLFDDFVFLLEIELFDCSYLTIRRSVRNHSKICFKKHTQRDQDYSWCSDDQSEWDHTGIPFKRAKELLDSLLDLKSISHWHFRKTLGYLIRSQTDYTDVYQLSKFKGSHSDWKPYLTHILGFNGKLLEQIYEHELTISEEKAKAQAFSYELNTASQESDHGKLDGILLLKNREISEKTALLNQMSFESADVNKTHALVDDVDAAIASLNADRYRLMQIQKTVKKSLEEEQILFDPKKAKKIFDEAGILFDGQIKKDFEQLIEFNRAISTERHQYLSEELQEIEAELFRVNIELQKKNNIRSESLKFLAETNVFDKYKQCTNELVHLRSEVETLERLRSGFQEYEKKMERLRSLQESRKEYVTQFEKNVAHVNSEKTSRFSIIRLLFDEIIRQVINRNALLSVSPNKDGHPDFQADILDENKVKTSAGLGHSYMRLLCVAFDLAVLRSHLDDKFPRFIFHDGLLESLETRKKENLIAVVRQYSQLGIQHIITLLDSEIPSGDSFFDESEIILRLHDEGQSGRLFHMNSW